MDFLPQLGAGGLFLLGSAALAGITLVAALWHSHARQRLLDERLARSREDVASLSQQVEQLSSHVGELTRRPAANRAAPEREYVITSLPSPLSQDAPVRTAMIGGRDRPASTVVEDQLVHALTRQLGSSPLRDRGVGLVVRTMALASGVRRALSQEVIDRAAAEAQVARRRSRRERKRELREARRLVRAVRAQETAHRSAA